MAMATIFSFLAEHGHVVAVACVAAALLVLVLLMASVIRDVRAMARRRAERSRRRPVAYTAKRRSRPDPSSLGG
jgi:uncharacterized membrane protein YcjF (UPF0283 family)